MRDLELEVRNVADEIRELLFQLDEKDSLIERLRLENSSLSIRLQRLQSQLHRADDAYDGTLCLLGDVHAMLTKAGIPSDGIPLLKRLKLLIERSVVANRDTADETKS